MSKKQIQLKLGIISITASAIAVVAPNEWPTATTTTSNTTMEAHTQETNGGKKE